MRIKVEKQQTIEIWEYHCDSCNKVLDDMEHLSITFGPGHSGYVDPENYKHTPKAIFVSGKKEIYQFCSTRCLGRFLKGNEL